jgi:hypothetical protein
MALQLEYRGGSYYISEEELNDSSITEMSAYLDEGLSSIAEIDGGHLVFKKEQLDETTMASSAGAYVPALTGGIVRRKLDVGRVYDTKQSDDNEIVKGFKLKKPIGRIFSLGLKEGEEEIIQSKGHISDLTAGITDAFSKLTKYHLGDWRKLMRGEEVEIELIPIHEHRGFPDKFKYVPPYPGAGADSFTFERIDGARYKVKAQMRDLNENILNKIIYDKVRAVLTEDRTYCDDPTDGEYFCMGGSDNIGATDLYKDDGHDIVHKFGDVHLSDISPDAEETLTTPGTKTIKKTVLKPALHKAPFNISVPLSEEKIDLHPKFTKKDLYSLMGESLNEDKAYKSATNNELALYVTMLSNQKVAAKSRGKTEEVEYLEKDIEEVKRELQHRKVKDSSNEEDLDEMTTAGSGAAGAYSGPSMWAKNRRNWRLAAKPTWNGGSFVKFKDKCVKYNNKKWCSQGAIDKPIELVSTLMETAYKLSEETGKDIDHITQLITKKYSVPNEHVTDSVIELAKESGYDMFSGVGQTEFTKDIDGGTEHEISIDGVSGDINAMVHNIEDNTFSGKTFDTFEDAIEYLETI